MQEPTEDGTGYRRIDMQIFGIPQHMLPQRGYFDYLAERMQEIGLYISDTQDGIRTKAPIRTDIINPKEVTITVSLENNEAAQELWNGHKTIQLDGDT
eukprot:2372739-Rhodomonas_salina.1